MKDLFKTIILDNQRSFPKANVWRRQLELPLDSGKIICIAGPRRCGKTYFQYHLVNSLCAAGKREKIVYINFEDERLDLSVQQLQFLLDAYFEIYPDADPANAFFFFDEIQEIAGWEKFVRRLYDSVSRNIFITGSSAKMLDREIATALRGRNLVYYLQPLSFFEYCRILEHDTSDLYSTKAQATLRNAFRRYLRFGGFPEVVTMSEEMAQKTLQVYFDVMLFRDIVERHNVSQVNLLKKILKRIVNNIGRTLSMNKVYNEMKSMGMALSKNTLYNFLDYAVDCFFLYLVYPYEPSVVRQEMMNKKVYAVDTGLVNAVSYRFSDDSGHLLENLVFKHLFDREQSVFCLKNKYECDFVVEEKGDIGHAIQVSLSLRYPSTKEREIRGLLHAMDRFGLNEGWILTLDEDEDLDVDKRQIHVKPCWKWTLQNARV